MALTAYLDQPAFECHLEDIARRAGFVGVTDEWDAGDGVFEIVANNAIARAGLLDVTDATTVYLIRKLNLAGEIELWREVVRNTVRYRKNTADDGSSADLQQIHAQAKGLLALAKDDYAALVAANEWTGESLLQIIPVRYDTDGVRGVDEFAS